MNTSLLIIALACTVACVYANGKCFKEGAMKKKMEAEMAKSPVGQKCMAAGDKDAVKACFKEEKGKAKKECEGKDGADKKECVMDKLGFKCDRTYEQVESETLEMCLEGKQGEVKEAISACKTEANPCFCACGKLKKVCDDMKHHKKEKEQE